MNAPAIQFTKPVHHPRELTLVSTNTNSKLLQEANNTNAQVHDLLENRSLSSMKVAPWNLTYMWTALQTRVEKIKKN